MLNANSNIETVDGLFYCEFPMLVPYVIRSSYVEYVWNASLSIDNEFQ